MKIHIPIMMYIGSLSIFLSFFFPIASPSRFYPVQISDINWIWSFSSHELLADYSIIIFGINIFTIVFILICPIMITLTTFLAQRRKISKEAYEKRIFTYSTTILFLTTNMLIVLPYLQLHTIEVTWFTTDIWSHYYPNFGLVGLFLGVALISLGVLFSLKFVEIKLYQILIITTSVCIFIVNPLYYDLQGLLTSFITIILIFFIYSYTSETISIGFLAFIVILSVIFWIISLDSLSHAFYLITISYFWNFQSLLLVYLPFVEQYYQSFYFPVILFFAFLLYLYIRKKPDGIVRESKIEQSLRKPLIDRKNIYTRSVENIILEFLKENKDKAFTSKSIYERCEKLKEFDLTTSDIKRISDNLIVWRKIGSHEKEGELFYIALKKKNIFDFLGI